MRKRRHRCACRRSPKYVTAVLAAGTAWRREPLCAGPPAIVDRRRVFVQSRRAMKAILRQLFLRRWWTLSFFALAFVGFIASLVVHLGTYFADYARSDHQIVFVLHGLCLAMCFLMLPFTRRMEKLWGRRATFDKDYGGRKGRRIINVVGAYALINFALFLGISVANGQMRVWEKDGVYHARGWKSADREISEAEYRQHKVRVLRGFSGHWMLFFALPALFFLQLKPIDLFEPESQPVKKEKPA